MSPPRSGRIANNFEEAITNLINSINMQMPNVPSLLNFFSQFDAFESRVFEDWEM
jgi:hypothetical protein